MDMEKLKEQFKTNGKDSEELRRRRVEEMVELRKATKDDQLSRRRKIEEDESSFDEDIELDPMAEHNRLEKINAIKNLLFGNDPAQQLIGLKMAHEFLKTERPRPIDLFVSHGTVPRLVEYLKRQDNAEVQYIAAWILTTIAFGNHDQTNAVVQAGAVDVLLELFDSPIPRIVDQAVWCIGNISGDGPEMQQYLVDKGLISKLIKMADSDAKLSAEHLSNIVWTLANMCENPGHPNKELQNSLRVFSRRIFHRDIKVVREAVRGVSMLSSNEEWLDDIYDQNILTEITYLLESHDWRVVKPCLKIVGHFAAGSDRQVQYILDCVALPAVLKLMKSPKRQFMKEATRAAGNIACGTIEQILTLMNAGIGEHLVHVLDQGDKDSQVEALHLLTNMTTLCKIDQLVYLEKTGVIPAVCRHLSRRSNSAIYAALKSMHNILRIADKYDELEEYVELIEEAKGKEYIEQLQSHENATISSRASYILDKFFNENETSDTTDSDSEMGSGDTVGEMVMQVSNDFEFDF